MHVDLESFFKEGPLQKNEANPLFFLNDRHDYKPG